MWSCKGGTSSLSFSNGRCSDWRISAMLLEFTSPNGDKISCMQFQPCDKGQEPHILGKCAHSFWAVAILPCHLRKVYGSAQQARWRSRTAHASFSCMNISAACACFGHICSYMSYYFQASVHTHKKKNNNQRANQHLVPASVSLAEVGQQMSVSVSKPDDRAICFLWCCHFWADQGSCGSTKTSCTSLSK